MTTPVREDSPRLSASFPKSERICGKNDIAVLMGRGRKGVHGCLRYCRLTPGCADTSRLLVSVPKRLYKRAVKRNLLKRRIREAWRHSKDCLEGLPPTDLLITYTSPTVLGYEAILADLRTILEGFKK